MEKRDLMDLLKTLETTSEVLTASVAKLISAARQLDRTGKLDIARIADVSGDLSDVWIDIDLQALTVREILLCDHATEV